MFFPYIDINPNHDASTTLVREHTEYRIQAAANSYEDDLIKLNEFIKGDLISVFTNFTLSDQQSIRYNKDEYSDLGENFDLISKFEFKDTKQIKARLRRIEYNPTIIIDID